MQAEKRQMEKQEKLRKEQEQRRLLRAKEIKLSPSKRVVKQGLIHVRIRSHQNYAAATSARVHANIDDEDSEEEHSASDDHHVSAVPNNRGVVKNDADTSMRSDGDDDVPTTSVKQVRAVLLRAHARVRVCSCRARS